jgi:protein phosphatase
MRLEIGAKSDIGRVKKKNEDYFCVCGEDTPGLTFFIEGALVCVADGLGGHIGGEIASKLAVSIFKDVLKEPDFETNRRHLNSQEEGPLPMLKQAITHANERIYRTNLELGLLAQGKPMGTTMTAAVIQPGKAYIVNVGDSRCYLLRENKIIKMTEDHSWVDEQVKLGKITREEASTHKKRNMVTRSVGTHLEVESDTYVWALQSGDSLLLCSDGLVNMVSDENILNEIRRGGSCDQVAQRLVTRANEGGGSDNITVILVRVGPSGFQYFRNRVSDMLSMYGPKVLRALAFLMWSAACAGAGYYLHHFLKRG